MNQGCKFTDKFYNIEEGIEIYINRDLINNIHTVMRCINGTYTIIGMINDSKVLQDIYMNGFLTIKSLWDVKYPEATKTTDIINDIDDIRRLAARDANEPRLYVFSSDKVKRVNIFINVQRSISELAIEDEYGCYTTIGIIDNSLLSSLRNSKLLKYLGTADYLNIEDIQSIEKVFNDVDIIERVKEYI